MLYDSPDHYEEEKKYYLLYESIQKYCMERIGSLSIFFFSN